MAKDLSTPKADVKSESLERDSRKVVFIKHGNPEDNDFTSWLGSRLTAAGYEVWTDLTRLIAGESLWRDIDVAIRNDARKQIVILSRRGVEKEGVFTEIDIGKATSKRLDDDRFLIPVKIDDLPYDEVMPQMMGRNIIDFSKNWADGLRRVLKALKRDNVSRSANPDENAAHRWLSYRTEASPSLEQEREGLITNWHLIRKLPDQIFFYEIQRPLSGLHEVASIASNLSIPAAEHQRLLVGFAQLDEFQDELGPETILKTRHVSELDSFRRGIGHASGPNILKSSARAILASLLRQGFDCAMRNHNLREYKLPAAGKVWWVPREIGEGKRIHFTRPDGSRGWRILVGRSERLNRFWHFGVYALPTLGSPDHLVLRPHIIFSKDGSIPEGGQFRRSFCKAWFNAKWRDLLLAFLKLVSDGKPEVELPVSRDWPVVIDSMPLQLTSPVRIPKKLDRPKYKGPTEEGDVDDDDGLKREDDPYF